MEAGQRIMGLDIGTKRTGVAVSDETLFLSSPVHTIETRDPKVWVSEVTDLVKEREVGEIVVGVPLNQYGEEGEDAAWVKKRIELLRSRVTIPVVEWDERFTTVQAERRLLDVDMSRGKRKKVIDKVAATIILQGYLDSRNPRSVLDDDYL